MKELIEELKRVKSYISEAEEIYENLKAKEENPPSWMVILPLAYKRFVDANAKRSLVDDRLLAFAGHYFGSRYPDLAKHFVKQEDRERMRDYMHGIEEYLDDGEKVADDGKAAGAPEETGASGTIEEPFMIRP